MTTLTARTEVPAPAREQDRLTFARLLRSETIKLTSLRSTWWSLGIAAGLSVGLSAMIAAASRALEGGFDPVLAITMPAQLTMLVAGILGAIAVTGEYSTGMIRSTLTAEPRRARVALAKALVVALFVALTTLASYTAAIAVTAPLQTPGIAWDDPARSFVPLGLGVLAMAAYALIGTGFGFAIRNGAGAIAATVGVLFVLPIVLSLFTIAGDAWRWIVDLGRYLPAAAGAELASVGQDGLLVPGITLAAWVVALLALGITVLQSRDA